MKVNHYRYLSIILVGVALLLLAASCGRAPTSETITVVETVVVEKRTESNEFDSIKVKKFIDTEFNNVCYYIVDTGGNSVAAPITCLEIKNER